ncbi:MAG: hypothetical protein ACOY4C_13505 [Pseudomonadota bacterium]|jgi:hypothetical protein
MIGALALAIELPPIPNLAAPVINLEAHCQMRTKGQAQYDLRASLKAVPGKGHQWKLDGPASPYPIFDGNGWPGRNIDSRTYQFDVIKNRKRYRYALLMAYSGFIRDEPTARNAIMTVSEDRDDTFLFVASGICDVETSRQSVQ